MKTLYDLLIQTLKIYPNSVFVFILELERLGDYLSCENTKYNFMIDLVSSRDYPVMPG